VWQLDAGLPRPRMNWPVSDDAGRYLGKPDLLCTELGVYGEYDGADHRSRRRHRVDVRRHDDFRRVGLEGFVVVGEDLRETRLVVDRMQAAVRRAARSGIERTWRIRSDPGPP
jgi:hypothetical protein